VAEIKLTKNELRAQQNRLGQLRKYLPTLQLKKAMLQSQVNEMRIEILELRKVTAENRDRVAHYGGLLAERTGIDPKDTCRVKQIHKRYENIAGVEVPHLEGIDFEPLEYSLFESPPWLDAAVDGLRAMVRAQIKVDVAEEKKAALEKELREVSIRVNLFEKILIPRAIGNIKKIKVFLGDQELAAVSQAKVAKKKIVLRKVRELAAADV